MPVAAFVVRGRVQGVGFRFYARESARALDLAGWVRNASDGSVEAEATGSVAALDAFHRALKEGPRGAWIADVSRRELQPAGKHQHPFAILE